MKANRTKSEEIAAETDISPKVRKKKKRKQKLTKEERDKYRGFEALLEVDSDDEVEDEVLPNPNGETLNFFLSPLSHDHFTALSPSHFIFSLLNYFFSH